MYYIIPQEERQEYSYKQLRETYDGKWLYLVNTLFSSGHELIKGTPVVIADSELEGLEDGIYEVFQQKGFGMTADADFTDLAVAVPSIMWSEDI